MALSAGSKLFVCTALAMIALFVLFSLPLQHDPKDPASDAVDQLPPDVAQPPSADPGKGAREDRPPVPEVARAAPAPPHPPRQPPEAHGTRRPRRDGPGKRVSIVVALSPSLRSEWLYPNPFPCEGVTCELHYDTTPQAYGVTDRNKARLRTADVYAVYINGPMHDEFYDVHANPYNLTLMVTSNECMTGRETVLSNMKHWWIHRFASNPNYWKRFHITNTLEQQSTIPWSYHNYLMDIPEIPAWIKANPPLPMARKHQEALALFMSSHPGHTYNRYEMVRRLSGYTKLDYYGKGRFKVYFKNAGGAPNVTRRERPDCPLSFWYEPTITLCMIRPYYFNLAMENSVALDYVTEKLYDPLLVGVVPVYKGAPNVENFVPPHTIIKFDDFEHVSHLAYYLRCVANTPELYEYYRNWRQRTSRSWERLKGFPHPFCRACQLVANRDPILTNVSHRIPQPQPLLPENRGNQRPFTQCVMPGTTLVGYD